MSIPSTTSSSSKDQFSSTGFILAAIGSAVGLGNMWKFPYITGKYGGGAFFVVFIGCLILVGLPILLAELSIGRRGRGDASTSFARISGNKLWGGFGLLSIIGSYMIMSFYAVVTGWTIHYMVLSFSGELYHGADYGATFSEFTSGYLPLLWQLVTMVVCVWVLVKGVSKGIESFNKILIPGLVILLLILMMRTLSLSGAMEGVRFFLQPDFGKLTPEAVLAALGHAFFSLSLGMGTMITYGAYVHAKQPLSTATLAIGGGDLLYALIAGLIIFPTAFAFNLGSSSHGPGLVFIILPKAFEAMPLGMVFGGLFFLLLAIAALTSAISLLEVPIAYAITRWGWSRSKAAVLIGGSCFLVGIPAALSTGGPLTDWQLGGKTYFDWLDFIASNILLPFGGLLVTIFAGYVWKTAGEEAGLKGITYRIWLILLRYIAPIMVVGIFLYSIGLI